MGASGWSYRVPFEEDARRAFLALQERELAGDDLYWQEEDEEEEDEEFRSEVPPRPTSLAQLAEIKDDERYHFWEWGTHSILDMDRLEPADAEDHDGGVRLLSPAEVRDLLGSDRPTADDFEAAYARLGDLGVARFGWTGRYTVLYRDGRPDELAFCGISGD
jgi:hypothetical protein